MKFFVAKDARVLNALANDPDILPFISEEGTDWLDVAGCFTPERIDRIRFYHNGVDDSDETATIAMLFQWTSPNIWALHMMARKSARGGPALEFAKLCVEDMFMNFGAKELWGETPVWNERARLMHRKVGGISRGFGIHHKMGEVELFATSKAEWEALRAK